MKNGIHTVEDNRLQIYPINSVNFLIVEHKFSRYSLADFLYWITTLGEMLFLPQLYTSLHFTTQSNTNYPFYFRIKMFSYLVPLFLQ